MPDNKRKTRREVQAELKANRGNADSYESVANNESSTREQNPTKPKKSFISPLFLIEAVLVVWFFHFLGLTIVAVLALIPFIYSLLTKRNAKKGKKRPKGTGIVFIIYLLICIIGFRVYGVFGSLVSNAQTNQFYVLALEDDSASDVSEIEAGYTIGLGPDDSYTTNVFPRAKFAEEGYDFNYTTYNSDTDAVENLIAGNERYIVVEDAKSKDLKAIDGYKSDVKIIGHYKEKINIQSGDKNVTKETFTVLLTGVDTRVDSIDSNSRSDSIMVAKINPKTAQATLISLPRDAYIESSCTGGYDKITHSSLNGMNCLIDDVESLLDVEIDYYLTVNFFAVIDAIDSVGGIDVDVEAPFCGQDENDNLGAYCLDAGEQHLSGGEALSYARERHSFSDGDYARTRHQQQVITAFLNALASSGPFAISDLLDVASDSARTNLSASQLKDLAKLLQKKEQFTIDSYTVEGYGMYADLPYWGLYGTSVQNLDDTSIAEAKSKLAAVPE